MAQPVTTTFPQGAQLPDSVNDPANLIKAQGGSTSPRAPSRASRSVRSARTKATVQVSTRAPRAQVTTLPPPTDRVLARRRTNLDADPYAPLGLRIGNIVLRPAITNTAGYDTNPSRASTSRKGSWFARSEGELGVESDWSVHQLSGILRGGYSKFFADKNASRPDAEARLGLRLDYSRDTRFDAETRLRLDTQRPGSTDLDAAVTGRPITYAYGASAGVTHDINRLQLSLRGSVDRTDYEDAKLTNGRTLSQSDRNQTQYGLRARVGYEVMPGIRPFIEGLADTRRFDETTDSSGFRRSSNGYGGRVGSTFELTRQLTGEVAVGYQTRAYEDGRLKDLRGVVGDAALIWSATPLTTVTLRGSTELADTTLANVSGAVARRASLEVAHALMRNLTVTGFTTFSRTDYDRSTLREEAATVGARLEYRLTRTFAVRASFTHERLNSTTAGSDYTANIAQVGLRMQF